MKSLLTFLAFNVVLLICCYEKKCAGSMRKSSHIEMVNDGDNFLAKFETDKIGEQKWDYGMHLFIADGFVKGYYCEEGMRQHINVAGVINGENEMILMESENGKLIRTFRGKYQNKGKGVMLLSGIWKSTNNTMLTRFFKNNIILDSDPPQAFLLISKKQ